MSTMAASGRVMAQPSREGSWPLRVTSIFCTAALLWGYMQKDDSDLVPEAGLGYALGIIGLAQMVLMLAYSLRKRLRWMRRAGRIQRWFEVHMMLGLMGPTAIVLHSNFDLGSLNSSVALISMLLVSGSGIAGRFIYVRIHRTLLGERLNLASEISDLRSERGALCFATDVVAGFEADLDRIQQVALGPNDWLVGRALDIASMPLRAFFLRRRYSRFFSDFMTKEDQKLARDGLSAYLGRLRRDSRLGIFEWLFGLWHAVHLPLSFVLFGSAAVHVVAVHMY